MRAVRTHPNTNAPFLLRRAAIVLPVLLLHAVLLWLMTQGRPERSDIKNVSSAQPMFLRWIESAVTAPPPATAVVPRVVPTQERNPEPRVVSRALISTSPPLNSTTPASDDRASQPPAAATKNAPVAAETARPTVTPLDLRLPRATSATPAATAPASLAAQDGRANSERASISEKLAEALGGDGRRSEENLGDGRIRFRSGADCVIAEESRAGQLDPMSQTNRPAPRGVKPCK
jgi:hypothetical protein